MASKCSKDGKLIRYKCLSTITLGGNEIRFVGVNERNNGVHFPNSVSHCPGRLLFLASDVMCSTKLSKKNYIRVITRFSKLGYAVKMRLSGFKIEGINNSSVIWFFSVQGLFRVAFDLGNLAFQRDCLSQLQAVWLKRYEDPLLPAESVLRFNKRLSVLPEDCQLRKVSHPQKLEREMEMRKSLGRSCTDKSILFTSELPVEVDFKGEPVKKYFLVTDDRLDRERDGTVNCLQTVCTCSSVVCNCRLVPLNCGSEFTSEETVSSENGLNVHFQNVVAGSVQSESPIQCNETNGGHDYEYFGTEEFRDKLTCFIQTTFLEEVSNAVLRQILLVLEYFKYFALLERTESYENFGGVIFRIMEEFLVLAGLDSELPPGMCKNSFGISREKFIFLYLISDWLGHEYHDLEGAIQQNVESFKEENITCIDSLPSADTIVDTLFPSFMKTFVSNWLGFYSVDLKEQNSPENVLADHCYMYTGPTKSKGAGNINYQLLQLILEFGSNCLISGIGHVVFSRLQIQNRTESDA